MSFIDQVNYKSTKSPKSEFVEEIAKLLVVNISTVYRNIQTNNFKPLHKKLIAGYLNEPESTLFPN